ncbi:UBX domain-containing protein 4 [Liparis tanakae]|uniref:UBX domain-containing protein 4 n=1 Tax=Liparis tanakae TaxID=230148 RepID=A0A4Z2GIF4_9TELE|nr:UBX domain-containing protein 4 [Liparis tanakae]
MLWFEGSIPDAINLAKQRGSVFVVVITGKDEQSAQLISSWEDDKVSEEAKNCCVAINVDAKSFFIGENGIPLEVIAGSVSAEELMKRINKVKQMHAQQIGDENVLPEASGPVENTPLDSTAPVPAGASATEPATVTQTAQVTPAEDASSDHASQSEDKLDAKVERLTKKLEGRQEQKKKGEEEKEIKAEVEQRKMGKDVQDLTKQREGERTKRLLDERNREKAEEKAARDRVKRQIALDRADRAARYSQTQEEDKTAKQARQADYEDRKEAVVRERSTIARIQFRLPDGSSFSNQFPSQSRLQEARHFAVQEVGKRYGNFSLATMFPRREFTSEDLDKTLLELELAPSASIVLLPQSSRPTNTVVQSSDGGVWAVLGTLLYPLLAVWRFLSSFLFATTPPPGAASRGSGQPSGSYTNLASASDKAKRGSVNKDTVEKQPKDFKKDGKICRLRNQEDSEDENNTWNGNSTQQM